MDRFWGSCGDVPSLPQGLPIPLALDLLSLASPHLYAGYHQKDAMKGIQRFSSSTSPCIGDKTETMGEKGNVVAKLTQLVNINRLESGSAMLCPPYYINYNVIPKEINRPQGENFPPVGKSMALPLTFSSPLPPSLFSIFIKVKHVQNLKSQLVLQDWL